MVADRRLVEGPAVPAAEDDKQAVITYRSADYEPDYTTILFDGLLSARSEDLRCLRYRLMGLLSDIENGGWDRDAASRAIVWLKLWECCAGEVLRRREDPQ